MKYIVMECHFSYAVLLDEDGKFLKAANRGYQVGQTVYDPVLVGDYHYRPPAVRIIGRVIGLLVLVLALFLCIRYCGSDTPSNSNATQGSSDPAVTAATVSESHAKSVALAHAGVSADSAVFESIELDEDDGAVVYELDFIANGIEYEYEIDALTGKILKHQSEPID